MGPPIPSRTQMKVPTRELTLLRRPAGFQVCQSVLFAGLVSPGLYQFNVVVPASATTGDNTLTALYGIQGTQIGVLLSVQ